MEENTSTSTNTNNQGAAGNRGSYSWWDIQDVHAKLPVQECTYADVLHRYFIHNNNNSSTHHSNHNNIGNLNGTGMEVVAGAKQTAKQALKGFTKAISEVTSSVSNMNMNMNMNNVSSANDDDDPFARMPMRVLVLQILDLNVLRRKYAYAYAYAYAYDGAYIMPSAPSGSSSRVTAASARRHTAPSASTAAVNSVQRGAQVAEANLMDFGNSPVASTNARKTTSAYLHHHQQHHQATPRRTQANAPSAIRKNETRAEKLQREYKLNASKQERVWDEIDQRWVVKDKSNCSNINSYSRSSSTSSSSHRASSSATKSRSKSAPGQGISIDASNAIGKSAHVQQAVHARVNDMKKAQNQALTELRDREKRAKEAEEAEDIVRRKLEPKVKAWGEEHGKKKQLRALLASLQVILWPEAGWKTVNIGDILDDKKARRVYLKATLKVHPDKTKDLDPEKRFIAKRVFDALSQAFTEFEGKK